MKKLLLAITIILLYNYLGYSQKLLGNTYEITIIKNNDNTGKEITKICNNSKNYSSLVNLSNNYPIKKYDLFFSGGFGLGSRDFYDMKIGVFANINYPVHGLWAFRGEIRYLSFPDMLKTDSTNYKIANIEANFMFGNFFPSPFKFFISLFAGPNLNFVSGGSEKNVIKNRFGLDSITYYTVGKSTVNPGIGLGFELGFLISDKFGLFLGTHQTYIFRKDETIDYGMLKFGIRYLPSIKEK